jgi:hypothetical protein
LVDWGETECTMMRMGADSPLALDMKLVPNGEKMAIRLANKKWGRNPAPAAGEVILVLLPSGERFSGTGRGQLFADGAHALLTVNAVDPSLADKLAAARGIAVESQGARIFEMAFPSPAPAVTEFRRCTNTKLGEWGVDVAALAALKQRARRTAESKTVDIRDLIPVMTKIKPGTYVLHYDVTAKGKVDKCAVATTTAKDVAKALCASLAKNARYTPAIDSSGAPTKSQDIELLNFIPPTPQPGATRRAGQRPGGGERPSGGERPPSGY